MKAKALLTAILLASTNIALANGGLSIDNVEQHMGANDYVSTQNSSPQISVQGPIDQFKADSSDRDRSLVDTNGLKQSYDGRV